MSTISRTIPVQLYKPDPDSKAIADRLHVAIFRNKIGTVAKLLDCGENFCPVN